MQKIISLTTTPKRVNSKSFYECIQSLNSQDTPPDRILLWVPRHYNRFDNQIEVSKRTEHEIIKQGIEIRIVERDYGPGTKLSPALKDDTIPEDSIIVTADDDVRYSPEWLAGLIDWGDSNRESVISYGGRVFPRVIPRLRYRTGVDVYCRDVTMKRPINIVLGWSGVLYRKHFFQDDFFEEIEKAGQGMYCDDTLVSGYLAMHNVERLLVPVDTDIFSGTEAHSKKEYMPLWRTKNNGHGPRDINVMRYQKYWEPNPWASKFARLPRPGDSKKRKQFGKFFTGFSTPKPTK